MKIFKNRGDIYVSKSGYKSSKEERILLALLGVCVAFTIVFVIVLGNKYDYSIKKFFATDKVTQIVDENEDVSEQIPVISGKTNYLMIETNDDKNCVFYAALIQADGDNLAYKVTTLNPQTKIQGKTINDIFLKDGIKKLHEVVGDYFGFKVDYYVQFTHSSFKDFIDSLGTFLYPSSETLKFSGGQGNDQYSVRISEGEQKINSKTYSDLLRYYVNEKQNFEIANEIMLYSFMGLINENNNEKAEKLFRIFISDTITNITVRDYANSAEKISIFSKNTQNVKVYSCVAAYDGEYNLTQEAMSNIENYFNK